MKSILLNTLSVLAAIHIATFSSAAADYTLPFELQPSQTVFDDQCKTFDVDGDKTANGNGAWMYQASSVAGGMNAFRYFYHPNNKADDWLMLPMVNFGNSTEVTVSFDVKTDAGVESFDLFLGNAQTIEAMTIPVISKVDQKYPAYTTLTATVRVPASSNNEWCLGFHAQSQANQYWIDITNISIVEATGEVTVIPGLPVIKNSSMNYLDYTATVEMPTQSVAGDVLSENMTLNVFVDGSVAATFSDLAPGASKSISLTLEAGTHTIGYQAVLNEEAGSMATESVVAEKKIVTPGKPAVSNGKVTGLVYTASVKMPATDTEGASITGTMSLKVSENGTVINTTTDLAAGATAQVEIPLSIGTHTLAFTALLDNVSSEPVEETVTVEEPVYELPFTFTPTADSFKECVVIDANGDGGESPYATEGKWTFSENALCYTNSSNDQIGGDDWVILPFVNVGESKKIKISLNAKNSTKYPEGFELWIGNVRNISGMTEKVGEYKNYNTGGAYQPIDLTVNVPATGGSKWALGIHAISEPDQFKLFINDISITAVGEDNEIPQAPVVLSDNLEESVYSATLKMPTLSVAGEALDADMNLKVILDSKTVLTKENLAPGSETDIELTLSEGTHTIAFIAAIGNNESEALTVNVTVKGEEIVTGGLPYNFTATQDSFDSCIVMDVNGDGVTKNDQTFGMWSYQWLGENNGGGAFKYCYSSEDKDADDWIILPMVDFGESEGVTVSFDVMTEYDAESFEVYLGRERTIEAMTLPVVKCKDYSHTGSFDRMSKLVVLPEATRGTENEWCLGIHASSPANKYLFYINNIEIKSSVITGISEVNVTETSNCEYYNLQGLRIENPMPGEIVIVRKGGVTFKKVMP